MTEPTARTITVDELEALPVGVRVRQNFDHHCPTHGHEAGYTDYLRLPDGTWELTGVDEPSQADFDLMQALGMLTPVDTQVLLDAAGEDLPEGASMTWAVLEGQEEAAA